MRVWVDCTAAAHPLVLRPIIERLEARGDEVFVTAREYGQTLGILDRLGMPYTVGRRATAAPRALGKGGRSAGRSARLARLVWKRRPQLALAHGSVDLAVVSALFRIPSVQMQDYEFAGLQRQIAFRAGAPGAGAGLDPGRAAARRSAPRRSKLVRYPGLKEEYYLADFEPDAGGPRRARARPREGAGRRAAAAGDLRVPRPQRPLRRDDPPPRRGRGEAQAVVIPRTERAGRRRRGRSAPPT